MVETFSQRLASLDQLSFPKSSGAQSSDVYNSSTCILSPLYLGAAPIPSAKRKRSTAAVVADGVAAKHMRTTAAVAIGTASPVSSILSGVCVRPTEVVAAGVLSPVVSIMSGESVRTTEVAAAGIASPSALRTTEAAADGVLSDTNSILVLLDSFAFKTCI